MVYGLVFMVRDYGVGFPAPLILPEWGESWAAQIEMGTGGAWTHA